jgi:glycosyltransferase involved in cell wall biosynthesis
LPVITTNMPGIAEVIQNRMNGLLVQPGNTEELKNAMINLVNDEDLRYNLAQGALTSSVKFEADNVIPKLAEILGIY